MNKSSDSRNTQDVGASSKNDPALSSKSDLELSSKNNLESSCKRGLESCSKSILESNSKHNEELSSKNDLESSCKRSLEPCSKNNLGSCSKHNLELCSKSDEKLTSQNDLESSCKRDLKSCSKHIVESSSESDLGLSSGSAKVHHLLQSVLEVLLEEGALDDGGSGGEGEGEEIGGRGEGGGKGGGVKVTNWKHPEELKKVLDLSLGEQGAADQTSLVQLCRHVIRFSVKTGHRYFLNQLYGGADPWGLAGAWVSEALNTNQYTYEVAPAFTLAEHEVIQKVLHLFGFQDGDGIFSPGGSISNMYAISMAKYRQFPETKCKGLSHLPPLCIFTSEDSHYSMLKAAHWLGVGIDNVIRVKTNSRGQMIASCLEEAIKVCSADGRIPIFVNATAGTTVLGAFDPLDQVAEVCQRHKLWMHVDACWGGSLLFSQKYSSVLTGIHRADSVAWNPHKMLGAPMQCSILLIKQKRLLHQANATAAAYLFQQDKFYDVTFDSGDKSVQCGRKVDAFKLWLMWKARGSSGFGRYVDNAVDCSRYFLAQISGRPGFRLVIPEFQCSNICFWFIPDGLRGQTEDHAWWMTLAKVAPRIKEKLAVGGALMISYQPLQHRNLHNFFRLVTTCHPPSTRRDMDYVIRQIELRGAEVDEEIRLGKF